MSARLVASLPSIFIVSEVALEPGTDLAAIIEKSSGEKCERCWKYTAANGEVCESCAAALKEMLG